MFNKNKIKELERRIYNRGVDIDINGEKIGDLCQDISKAYTSDNFAECDLCGVLARKSKMNIEVEPTAESYDDGEPGFGVNEIYYCRRCSEEREEDREEYLKEKLIEIDGVGKKLAEKIIKTLK